MDGWMNGWMKEGRKQQKVEGGMGEKMNGGGGRNGRPEEVWNAATLASACETHARAIGSDRTCMRWRLDASKIDSDRTRIRFQASEVASRKREGKLRG